MGGLTGTKPREKVELGEDHVWLVLEAERVEPGVMAAAETAAVVIMKRKVKNRDRILRYMFV